MLRARVALAEPQGKSAGDGLGEAGSRQSEKCLPSDSLPTEKTDWLLRFFSSDFFDEWIAVSYLWRSRTEARRACAAVQPEQTSGVRDYLCNRMYSLNEERVEAYLSQLVALALQHPSPALARLCVDLCSRSARLACKVHWLLSAYAADERAVSREAVRALQTATEEAAAAKWAATPELVIEHTGETPLLGTLDLVQRLCDASSSLIKAFPADERQAALRRIVGQLSAELEALPTGSRLFYPLGRDSAKVLRLLPDETMLLNSKEKAPFLLLVEVVKEVAAGLPATPAAAAAAPPPKAAAVPPALVAVHLTVVEADAGETYVHVKLVPSLACIRCSPARHTHHRIPSDIGLRDLAVSLSETLQLPRNSRSGGSPRMAAARPSGPAGERWEPKLARLRLLSPHGHLPNWSLRPIIARLHATFVEAGLPLWLRPFEVLVTSSHSALIEFITDAPSLHTLKSRLPPGTSLRDHFRARYGEGTHAYRTAQRNFVESMAGYSILSYLFQLKDRHNGNLLLDDEGHIIHIDFSFMLSYSPGGINFESAPFKLTRELLEVMDSDAEGTASDAFNYFKVLCIQGFLAARKNADHLLLLAEMMQSWNVPCFRGGPRVLQQLRKRFHLGSTEEACVELVLTLIADSLDAWCTRQYDFYQRVSNGIL